MIDIRQVQYQTLTLSDAEAKEVTIKYLRSRYDLNRHWIKNGKLWKDEDDWRHGSVSTECVGTPTEEQILANKLLEALK